MVNPHYPAAGNHALNYHTAMHAERRSNEQACKPATNTHLTQAGMQRLASRLAHGRALFSAYRQTKEQTERQADWDAACLKLVAERLPVSFSNSQALLQTRAVPMQTMLPALQVHLGQVISRGSGM